jgi:hypothetical protein
MRALAILPLALACAVAALGHTPPEPVDIETGERGQVPPGWFVPTAGYAAELSAENPRAGQHCARLAGPSRETSAPFGNLMCALDAAPYRGKVVRLRAAVRVAGQTPQDRAQLWLRVDRTGHVMGFFGNMGDRPIRSAEWGDYEIVGDVAPDAETINLGLMLVKRGIAWLDDVRLDVLADVQLHPPERLRAPRGLENLIAFTRLLGYVRHFHPADQTQATDWGTFTVTAVPEVEGAGNAEQLAATLERLFRPIAPTVRVFVTGRRPGLPPELAPPATDGLRLIACEHHGLGGPPGAREPTKTIYRSARSKFDPQDGNLPEWLAAPNAPWEADLGGGVSCLVPLTLYADGKGTLPHVPAPASAAGAAVRPVFTGNDRSTRLADVALAWSVLQHIYPYFDVVQTDWNAALAAALTTAATDQDERAFLDTLRRLMAELQDGHARVSHPCDRSWAMPPLAWERIEEHLVITAVEAPSSQAAETVDLRPGDVVVAIDGRPVKQVVDEAEALVSGATPQWRRWRTITDLYRGEAGQPLKLTVLRRSDGADLAPREGAAPAEPRLAGRLALPTRGNPSPAGTVGPEGMLEFTVLVQRSLRGEPVAGPQPEKLAEVRSGIFYVDVERITDADLQAATPKLARARGVIYDFRGYPSHWSPQALFGPLIDQKVESPQWHVPFVTRPDRQDLRFERVPGWVLTPSEPHIAGRRAFLIDGRAISYAESCLGIIENYKLGELVGEPTAGTNGNVNHASLPGGYMVAWTGMKVLKHDGSQHHGIGILPTIPVHRTIAGVRAGRDELLERAIEAVSATDNP